MITGDGVNLDGKTLTIQAESEATAREMLAAATATKVKAEGTLLDKAALGVSRQFDGLAALSNKASRNTVDLLAWALAIVGGFFAWVAGTNLWSNEALAPFFGAFGVIVLILGKVSATRWAKASNREDKGGVNMYRAAAVICLCVSFLLGFSLQSSTSINRESGALANKEQIQANEASIRRQRLEADALDRPRETAVQIEAELESMFSRPAVNYNGANARFNIAEAVERGTDTYCRGSTYYKNKYCPDLLDLEGALKARKAYRERMDAITDLENATTALRANHDTVSSAEAFGKMLAGTGENANAKTAGFMALLILFVDFIMYAASYFAAWRPQGEST